MKILLAEDEPTSLLLLKARVGSWGHDVIPCEDGTQAWEALQRPDAPKLAILDWMMPGLEGPELCRRVRELPHGKLTYLILLTARAQRSDIVEGLEAGANDYVTKPPDFAELRARIDVGIRVLDLQDRLIEAERSRVLVQAAGAAAHEINQPLTVLMGNAQILLMRMPEDDPHRKTIETLLKSSERISGIVKQMGEIREYITKPYIDGVEIIDFDASTGDAK
ncbi:MAG: response regulator [Candidatus Latescibacteria bacterium]|jgi:DNA-binding response OmpR family regulator|nr:response regulator [Candidatus Latescibacterota bacterium]